MFNRKTIFVALATLLFYLWAPQYILAVPTSTNVIKGADVDGNSTATSASISPEANTLYLATVASRTSTGVTPNLPVLSGNGLNWVAVNSVVYDTTGSSRRRLTLYRALGASPSAGQISINFSGQNQTDVRWIIDAIPNVDLSGSNGSGAIVQSAIQYDSSGSAYYLSVPLNSFGNPANMTYGAFADSGTNSGTPGPGFTQLGQTGSIFDTVMAATEYKNDSSAIVDYTFTSPNEKGGIALEIKTIAVTPTPTITPTATATVTPTGTPTATPTGMPTATVTPTVQPTLTQTPVPSDTPTPGSNPTPTAESTPSPTMDPAQTPTPTPDTITPTPDSGPSVTPTESSTPTPTAGSEPTSTPTGTTTPTSTVTPSPTPTVTVVPIPTPTPTIIFNPNRPDHTVIVIEENRKLQDVLGVGYFTQLANEGAILVQSYATFHPSQPNYIELFAGSNLGVTSNICPPPGSPFSNDNIGNQLLTRGYTFGAYAESLPTNILPCQQPPYAGHHHPWLYFSNIPQSLTKNMNQFPTDYSTLPSVSFVIPNNLNNAHDAPVSVASDWLVTHLDGYKQWAMTHNSLLIIHFDEDDDLGNNLVYTVFVGPMVKKGIYNERVTHKRLLSTLEHLYGVPYLTNEAPVTSIFN